MGCVSFVRRNTLGVTAQRVSHVPNAERIRPSVSGLRLVPLTGLLAPADGAGAVDEARERRAYLMKREHTHRQYRWRIWPTAAFLAGGGHARRCRQWG